MSKMVEVSGTVEDLFGHRFTLKTKDGKALIDLGPGAEPEQQVQPGDDVSVEGEQKPGEVKAKKLRKGGSDWMAVGSKAGHDESVVSDEHVTRTLNDAGFTDHGERVRKPKHVEVVATKDGKRHTVHVHKDGVKKTEPAG